MCVIIHLAAKASIKKEHLYNAVHNNWHGFGLIIKKGEDQPLEVIREFDDKGNNPEKIEKLLNDNIDYERVLHVRYNTKGESSLDNTQPFKVYEDEVDQTDGSAKREIWFAHNGTLNGYGDSAGTGKSDTLDFAEKILRPLLASWWGEAGWGDYTTEMFSKIVDKFWTSMSKGILFSNDLDALRFGNGWSLYKHTGDSEGEVYVSNTDYFDKLTRGPVFLAAEAERRQKEEEERKARQAVIPFGGGQSSVRQAGVTVWTGNTNKDPAVIDAVNDVIDQWELDDPDQISLLANVTYEEWKEVVRKQDMQSLAALLEHLARHLFNLAIIELPLKNEKITKLEEKHENATKMISFLKSQDAA